MILLQINGENYLLPSDLRNPSSRADLIHSSLNINWLVKQLSENYVRTTFIIPITHERLYQPILRLSNSTNIFLGRVYSHILLINTFLFETGAYCI